MSALPVGVRERQRAEVVSAICAGRRTVVVGPADGEGARAIPAGSVVALDAVLRGSAPDADAFVVLDPVPGRVLRRLALRLADRSAQGATVVLAVEPAGEALVAPVMPGAHALRQVAFEAVSLGSRPPASIEMPADASDGTVRVLLVLGDDGARDAVRLARTAVSEPYQAALLAELAELRGANARLRSTVRPVESAAAASVASVEERAAGRIADLERQIAALRRQVEHEVEMARHNDQLFQEAREILHLRDAEISALRTTLARPHHRMVERAGARASQVPVLSGVLRRTLRRLP